MDSAPQAGEGIVGSEGNSGHNLRRRFQYAVSIIAPCVMLTTCWLGRDLYMLEFGCDPEVLGLYWILLQMLSPALNMVIGWSLTDNS